MHLKEFLKAVGEITRFCPGVRTPSGEWLCPWCSCAVPIEIGEELTDECLHDEECPWRLLKEELAKCGF